ncbi:hypothetical protein HYQ45_006186 [Verticillium longisporum]|uniref:Uncharacterized protein n=1 Tax=Verticillium longisporum TaxID=100787 RepID=A0A8I2ZPF7_VERLO|nr:hypothetical protein HYQ45_006186 [Verticillium longisporum]
MLGAAFHSPFQTDDCCQLALVSPRLGLATSIIITLISLFLQTIEHGAWGLAFSVDPSFDCPSFCIS